MLQIVYYYESFTNATCAFAGYRADKANFWAQPAVCRAVLPLDLHTLGEMKRLRKWHVTDSAVLMTLHKCQLRLRWLLTKRSEQLSPTCNL